MSRSCQNKVLLDLYDEQQSQNISQKGKSFLGCANTSIIHSQVENIGSNWRMNVRKGKGERKLNCRGSNLQSGGVLLLWSWTRAAIQIHTEAWHWAQINLKEDNWELIVMDFSPCHVNPTEILWTDSNTVKVKHSWHLKLEFMVKTDEFHFRSHDPLPLYVTFQPNLERITRLRWYWLFNLVIVELN